MLRDVSNVSNVQGSLKDAGIRSCRVQGYLKQELMIQGS